MQSFFSGHYHTYGMNIQGACGHLSWFLFLGVAGPGVLGDWDTIFQCPLGDVTEKLQVLFLCNWQLHIYTNGASCSYFWRTTSEHHGKQQLQFLCISMQNFCIEMAFGMMVQKWGILKKPLTCMLTNVKEVVVCLFVLQSFTIFVHQ